MSIIQHLLDRAQADENHSSVSRAEADFPDQAEAAKKFENFKQSLLDINCWNNAGTLSSFDLFNQEGNKREDGRIAKESLLRISLKGTGKYDWVKVVEIAEAEREMVLTVQPTFDPNDKEKKTVSHFFTAEARNNFCLQLNESKVAFHIIGLNEKQNIAQTDDFVEAIRNWVTANVGSYLGLQKGEWTSFAAKFLKLEESKIETKTN